jgi:tetratricopeptide (TPR) repeat protein
MQKDIRTYYFHKPYKPLIPLVFIFLLIVFAGAALGLAFYPNIFHVGVTEHLKASFEVMKKFPVKITMLYKGKLINSLELPQGYKINAYLQTIPFFAWTGVCLFFAMSVKIFKRYSKIALSLLLFALIFPVLYIFFTDANVYNGWRHTMFIYSSFAVLSAIGFYELYELMSHKKWHLYWKTGVLIFFLISIFFPAKFIFKNYKYAYCFYNGLVSNPYQEYDQDYFETSGIVAFEWLHKHELNETDSVIISTKNTNLIHYQKNKQYPNIKIIKSGTLSFAEVDCDYSIITMQFLPKKVIKKIFPPKGTLHVETIDGNPICAVVKRNKLDINGIKAIQEDRFQDGIDLLEQAYDYDSNNFGIWYYMGVGYFHTGKYENTVEYFKKYLEFWATNTQQVEYAQYHTGLAYLNLKQYRKAISIMLPIYNNVQLVENKPAVGVNLGLAYFYLEEYPQAIFYLSQYIAYYPHLKEFLYYAYLETGDHANAQKLFTQK